MSEHSTANHTAKYRTIVADPPWRYQDVTRMRARTAEAHYPTMNVLTHCPICSKPLKFYGTNPACPPCVINGRKAELVLALEGR